MWPALLKLLRKIRKIDSHKTCRPPKKSTAISTKLTNVGRRLAIQCDNYFNTKQEFANYLQQEYYIPNSILTLYKYQQMKFPNQYVELSTLYTNFLIDYPLSHRTDQLSAMNRLIKELRQRTQDTQSLDEIEDGTKDSSVSENLRSVLENLREKWQNHPATKMEYTTTKKEKKGEFAAQLHANLQTQIDEQSDCAQKAKTFDDFIANLSKHAGVLRHN